MFIGYINSLTRKCYQQAFSSFQLETRDTIVELNCKFSSLLIRKNKCLKLKTRDRTKKETKTTINLISYKEYVSAIVTE